MVRHVQKILSTGASLARIAQQEKHLGTKRALLLPIPVGNAFDRVAVDVLRPFPPSRNSNRYIVFSDYLTRWCEAFPVHNAEASVIARLLIDEIIARHGAPMVLLSDRGKNFCLNLLPKCVKYFRFTN